MNGRGAAWLAAGALALARGAGAQSCTAAVPAGSCTVSTSTTLTAGTVMQMTLSSTTTTLTAPASAGYDAGYVADNGPTVTVKSNRLWKVQIKALAATWTAANTEPGVSARTNKPAADLLWSTASGGPFTALSTTVADAVTGSPSSGTTTSIFFRTNYNWTLDTPGQYSLIVVFTVINQ